MDDLRKRYIALAARDPKAKNPASMTYSEVSKAVARYEAASPAADTAGKSERRSAMGRKKKDIAAETNGKEKRKPGRPKKEAKVKKAKAVKAAGNGASRPRTGVGATIRALIAKDETMTNAVVAEKAQKAHPDSSTNAQCVAWYRNDMRKKGEIKKAA